MAKTKSPAALPEQAHAESTNEVERLVNESRDLREQCNSLQAEINRLRDLIQDIAFTAAYSNPDEVVSYIEELTDQLSSPD